MIVLLVYMVYPTRDWTI